MRLHQHIAVSTVISVGLYAWTQSVAIAVSSFLAGIFLDLDHIIDYWREHPFRMDLVHFFRTCEEFHLLKVYLFFHSVEFIIPLALLAYFTRSEWIFGALIGFCQHMLFDQLINPVYPLTYSFIYRWIKDFKNESVFKINS